MSILSVPSSHKARLAFAETCIRSRLPNWFASPASVHKALIRAIFSFVLVSCDGLTNALSNHLEPSSQDQRIFQNVPSAAHSRSEDSGDSLYSAHSNAARR